MSRISRGNRIKPKPPFRVANLSVRATKYADILIQELEPKRMGASPPLLPRILSRFFSVLSPRPPVKRKTPLFIRRRKRCKPIQVMPEEKIK